MEISTKFNRGDSVFTCQIKNTDLGTEQCNICDDNGKALIKGEKFTCPKCYGNKKVRTTKSMYKATEAGEITGMTLTHRVQEPNGDAVTTATYSTSMYSFSLDEDKYFKTKEEAVEASKLKNIKLRDEGRMFNVSPF